jgi:hypothetical protein
METGQKHVTGHSSYRPYEERQVDGLLSTYAKSKLGLDETNTDAPNAEQPAETKTLKPTTSPLLWTPFADLCLGTSTFLDSMSKSKDTKPFVKPAMPLKQQKKWH